jgi:hypothetical protein
MREKLGDKKELRQSVGMSVMEWNNIHSHEANIISYALLISFIQLYSTLCIIKTSFLFSSFLSFLSFFLFFLL